jgi:hypothetical protein
MISRGALFSDFAFYLFDGLHIGLIVACCRISGTKLALV